jgi:hypothetical protein
VLNKVDERSAGYYYYYYRFRWPRAVSTASPDGGDADVE